LAPLFQPNPTQNALAALAPHQQPPPPPPPEQQHPPALWNGLCRSGFNRATNSNPTQVPFTTRSISGHACVSVLIGLNVIDAPRVPLWWKAIVGATAVFSALAQVMVGDHYSVDLVMGVYVATFSWLVCRSRVHQTY
jgi:hypothetical protein